MNRIDRLFGILTLLQTKKHVTADKIADKFKISVRTVYRDIKALGELGIPVGFEQPKGYFIVQGYFLPPVSFSTEEANALLLMETMVAGFADRSILGHYSNALNKVKSVLKSSQKDKLEDLNKNMYLQLPSRLSNDFEYLSALQTAISAREVIEIEYTDNNDQASKRQIEAIGLIFYAFSWHIIAWCQLRAAYRDFKVSRIRDLKCTGRPFGKQDHIELSEYIKELPVDF